MARAGSFYGLIFRASTDSCHTFHNRSATALLDGDPKETTTPRIFLNTAIEQFKGKTLCGRVRLMVQSLLIQWMSNYSDETLLVQDEYNKFGGEKAVGLAFQNLQQKAQQGNGVVTPAGTASSYTSRANGPSEEAPSG